jgi:hypothetical protein
MEGLRKTREIAGLVAFYSDKHTLLCVNKPDAKGASGMTQFSRALAELNIEIICANFSQAKGRVERVNRTLQGPSGQGTATWRANSEKIGYRKRERKIYGLPEMPVNLAPGPATVEMPV